MAYTPVKGFAPDAALDEEGIFLANVTGGFIPTLRGIKGIPTNSDSGISLAPSAVAAAVSVELNDGTNRTIIGTEGGGNTSKLYEISTTDWSDISSGAGTYSATADARWVFASYNDEVFATQKGATLQASTSGEFTAVTGAPKASIVEVVLDFVVLFDIDDGGGVYGNDPNRWWCCAAGDPHSWTANIATQATTGLLTDSPGGIRAAKRLGSNLVAYKNSSMYLGQYINTPLVWGWQQIPGEGTGTWSPYSVVSVEGVGHLFIGYDNIYVFDGTRAMPIGTNRVAQYLFDNLEVAKASSIVGFHHRQQSLVYWWYPSNGYVDGRLDRFIVYNYRSQKWGYGVKEVQFAFEYLEPGLSYDGLGGYYATFDDLPNSNYDDAFASSTTFKPAIFDTSNWLQRFEGPADSNTIVTNWYGREDVIQLVDRVRPKFHKAPASGNMKHLIVDTLGSATGTVTASAGYARGVFDTVHSARWHQFEITFEGDWELLGLNVQMKEDALE